MGAIYKITSTALLMIYMANKVRNGRKFSRIGSRRRAVENLGRDSTVPNTALH
jgi:hypothetical protein